MILRTLVLEIYPMETRTNPSKNSFIWMFITGLYIFILISVKTKRELYCPLAHKWLNQLWYIKYSWILSPQQLRIQIWIYITTCKNCECTMLDEKVTPLIGNAQNKQICRDKKWINDYLGIDYWWQCCGYTKTWRVIGFFLR